MITITDKEISDALEKIPPIDHVVARTLALLRDPTTSARRIAQELAKDVLLSFEIMKIVNSPIYGFSRKVQSLEHAITLIGFKSVESIVLSAYTKRIYDVELKYFRLKRGELSIQAFIGAYAAKLVSQENWPDLEDITFASAVLRSVGKIIMNYFLSKHFDKIKQELTKESDNFDKIEKKIFGFTSNEFSVIVLERWGISEEIKKVIQFYNKLSLIKEKESKLYKTAVSVHIGDRIAMMTGLGASIDSMKYPIDQEIFHYTKIKPQDIERYLEKTVKIYPDLIREIIEVLPP
ncbi:MAG: HDOD domain-containing protein [Candidatus Calescibacterium sp.]|jgi:HD-like signal output (HDOD) protein|nr:HDOD domain-containing protein [Candidatus Calescibacterium sp.]